MARIGRNRRPAEAHLTIHLEWSGRAAELGSRAAGRTHQNRISRRQINHPEGERIVAADDEIARGVVNHVRVDVPVARGRVAIRIGLRDNQLSVEVYAHDVVALDVQIKNRGGHARRNAENLLEDVPARIGTIIARRSALRCDTDPVAAGERGAPTGVIRGESGTDGGVPSSGVHGVATEIQRSGAEAASERTERRRGRSGVAIQLRGGAVQGRGATGDRQRIRAGNVKTRRRRRETTGRADGTVRARRERERSDGNHQWYY